MFKETVNRCAFIDRVVIDLDGGARSKPKGTVSIIRNIPIGSKKSGYSRMKEGFCISTNNPLQFKYGKCGKLVRFESVPDYRLFVRSVERPITYAEVAQAVDGLMRANAKPRISLAEMTFDVDSVSVSDVMSCSFARTEQRVISLGGNSPQTLYLGSTRSAWQARIYEKVAGITRIEFVLRSTFLRQYGINRPHELLRLRHSPVHKLLALRIVSQSAVYKCFAGRESGWRMRVLKELSREPTEFSQIIKSDYGVNPRFLLAPAPIDKVLQRMGAMLIW